MKGWQYRFNQNKRKTVAPRITHLMCSLVLLLTISLQLVASYNRCLPIISACLHFIITHYTFAVLEKPCQGNFRKFQELSKSRFGGSERDRYFLKILKWQHKLVRDYKWGMLVSYFLNNAVKTCLFKLKISQNIEIKHSFSPKHFFISVAISTQVVSTSLKSQTSKSAKKSYISYIS